MKLFRPANMPENLEAYAGKPIVLETEASRDAVVKWWLNGSEIVESSNVTMTTDGSIHRLTIHSPTPEDSGKYSCGITDDKIDFHVKVTGKNPGEGSCGSYALGYSQGPLASSEPPVEILRKSEMKTELRFLVSDDVVLECELSRANVAAKWYKNDGPLEGDDRYCEEEEGAFRSLVILNAGLEDSGKYILDTGDDSVSFDVIVEGSFI